MKEHHFLIPNFDLTTEMQKLEQNLEYFVRIPPRKKLEYENDYHEIAIDPDGNIRELLKERDSSVENCQEIIEHINALKPGKILDFGCGLGWILSAIDNAWNSFGIEVSAFAANHAKNFAEIYCGDYNHYREKDFDVVIMNHVIEHLVNPLEALKFVKNSLKYNGLLIIGTPNFDCGAARKFKNKFRLLHDPTHISLFSEDSLRRFLRDNGFTIEKVEFPYFDTKWFNRNDLLRMFDENQVSPPFYGSFMTIFAKLSQ